MIPQLRSISLQITTQTLSPVSDIYVQESSRARAFSTLESDIITSLLVMICRIPSFKSLEVEGSLLREQGPEVTRPWTKKLRVSSLLDFMGYS